MYCQLLVSKITSKESKKTDQKRGSLAALAKHQPMACLLPLGSITVNFRISAPPPPGLE